MPLTHYYADAYLAPLVTEEREARAAADVAELGTLPAAWVARLVVARAYVLTCLESQRAADDTFSAKLSAYRKEWDSTLAQARAAQAAADAASGGTGSASIYTVALERA
ncbi:hypothetical protein [Aquariibacter albus]|uniref:Uncharacterized protein n=1 Tax=Aquariibacter albus TaxID=2759899 RepID=A0A839HR03_9BURK|nr:hypothetical protein [Aquariibacter albus]MBB1161471.1 hypothetical protein [Aquariibacter albus]